MSIKDWLVEHGYNPNSSIVLTELDWAWTVFLNNLDCKITTDTLSSIEINDNMCHTQSVVRLLFTPDKFHSSYVYLYKPAQIDIPSSYRYKISMLPLPVLMIATEDSDGYNLWSLSSEELGMLDTLLSYVQGVSISLPDFTTLTDSLSKLVHIFLDVVLNNNATNLTDAELADDRVLTQVYELYVRHLVYSKLLNGEDVAIP